MGHPHRDQERQLAPLVERAVRSEIVRQAELLDAGGRIVQETRHFDEAAGTPARAGARKRPPTTGTSPSRIWCRSRRTRLGSSDLRAALPELPAARRARLEAELGVSEDMSGAGQRRGGRSGGGDRGRRRARRRGRNWWLGELARQANEPGIEPAALP